MYVYYYCLCFATTMGTKGGCKFCLLVSIRFFICQIEKNSTAILNLCLKCLHAGVNDMKTPCD